MTILYKLISIMEIGTNQVKCKENQPKVCQKLAAIQLGTPPEIDPYFIKKTIWNPDFP